MDAFLETGDELLLNLGISLLIVIVGYFIGGRLLVGLARTLARRAEGALVGQAARAIEPQLRWFMLVLSLQIALLRLDFIDEQVKMWINQASGVLYIVIAFLAIWRLIGACFDWLGTRLEARQETDALQKLLPLLKQLSYFTLILVSVTVLLSYLGINVAAFVAALGVGGLAVSLAAQDTLADAISGALIILDRPFQVGDRIDVLDVGSPGDVIEIGLRSSRIRLLDNRQVIVPNGVIARSQVVNYTSPDPILRLAFEFGVSYGADVDRVRQVVTDAVQTADGVLQDRPVSVLFWQMGDSALIFRVEWWIDLSAKTLMSGVPVREIIYRALQANGIEVPYSIYDVNLKLGGEERALFARAVQ
jgi:small-conductance mechanosensitive channel